MLFEVYLFVAEWLVRHIFVEVLQTLKQVSLLVTMTVEGLDHSGM